MTLVSPELLLHANDVEIYVSEIIINIKAPLLLKHISERSNNEENS